CIKLILLYTYLHIQLIINLKLCKHTYKCDIYPALDFLFLARGIIIIKKHIFICGIILILIMLGSCTAQDKKKPEKVAEEFVSLWEEQDFDAMYTYLSNSSKEQYSKKEFIERNEKIFKDLQMSDLKISKADLT